MRADEFVVREALEGHTVVVELDELKVESFLAGTEFANEYVAIVVTARIIAH